MLGWDIAPYINGGLGVACHGMCKALSENVDITLVLPKVSESLKLKNVNLVGISQEEVKKTIREHGYEDVVDMAETKEVTINLDPYFEASQKDILKFYIKQKVKKGLILEEFETLPGFLSDTDVFGENVIEKIIMYANEVQKMARDMQFDVIHAHDWMTFLAGIYVKNESRKPLVLHVHSLDFDRVGPFREELGLQHREICVFQGRSGNSCEQLYSRDYLFPLWIKFKESLAHSQWH